MKLVEDGVNRLQGTEPNLEEGRVEKFVVLETEFLLYYAILIYVRFSVAL